MELVHEVEHVGGPAVLAIVLAVLGAPALIATASAILARRLGVDARRMLEAERDAAGALRAGLVTIAGDVAEVAEPPARVRIVEEARRGRRGTSWREVSRTVDVRAFELTHTSGESVWIEPGATPIVIADLDLAPEAASATRRTRQAPIRPHARIFATGFLSHRRRAAAAGEDGSYRDNPTSAVWVLADGPGQAVRLASRSLASLYLERRQLYVVSFVVAALVLGMLAVATHRYLELVLRGGIVEGRVENVVDDGFVRVSVPDRDFEISCRIDRADARALVVGDTVAVVALPDRPVAQIGREPSLGRALVTFVAVTTGIGALLFLGLTVRQRRWWERRTLVTRFDGVGGRADRGHDPA